LPLLIVPNGPSRAIVQKYRTDIQVIDSDILDYCQRAVSLGNAVFVIPGSGKQSGGGVAGGSMAFEEEVYRRTNINALIDPKFYRLNCDEIIFTPKVRILRDTKYQYMDIKDQFDIACITATCRPHPKIDKDTYSFPEDYRMTKQTIHDIFRLAAEKGFNVLLMCAIGCGVFAHPPNVICSIINECIRTYGPTYFSHVHVIVKNNKSDLFNMFKGAIVPLQPLFD